MARKSISREKIIEAALYSASKKSMGGTSLTDISDSLEIKKASLYNHFPSKDKILSATYTYCSDYLTKLNLFSDEVFSRLKPENAVKIFIQCTSDYIRRHEDDLLLQIYNFINTEKYFSKECLEIYQKQNAKIETQIFLFFKIAAAKDAFPDDNLKKQARYFFNGLTAMLENYIVNRKETIRQNPECDAGSLFALPSDDKGIAEITDFARDTVRGILRQF